MISLVTNFNLFLKLRNAKMSLMLSSGASNINVLNAEQSHLEAAIKVGIKFLPVVSEF